MEISSNNNGLYCSLDLELTGFDPIKDEVLEVGFVFFGLTAEGPVIFEEWSQVFQPTREVHAKIFGLTGIQPGELVDAPKFSEFHEFLQNKLGSAILVGHGIGMDVRFLEACGISLSGQSIDTLDLVQFILPTHHSYNLENLMHTFGVLHREAHRALADARATITVLEKLLQVYQSFPEALRHEVFSWAQRGGFLWTSLLAVPLTAQPFVEANAVPEIIPSLENSFPETGVVSIPLGSRADHMLLRKDGKKRLLAVPHNQIMFNWWKKGYVRGLVGPDDAFNRKKFSALMAQSELSPDQIRFIIKLLIWERTNWQTETILDLNLSFFGGQYRPLINDGRPPISEDAELLCCSHQTFLRMSSQQSLKKRNVIVYDMGQFERAVTKGIGDRASWGHIVYLLKSIYNPETGIGALSYEAEVAQALADTDLFFGLAMLYLQKQFSGAPYITHNEFAEQEYFYRRVAEAARHYRDQLARHNRVLNSPAIFRFASALQSFFSESSGRVKWIECDGSRCTFFNYPLEISPVVQKVTHGFPAVLFLEDCGDSHIVEYLRKRLGIESEGVSSFNLPVAFTRKAVCMIERKLLNDSELEALLRRSELPAIVFFNNSSNIKEFYKNFYYELKKYSSVFAQDYSGGGNKMFRNFGISPSSILLATPSYVQQSLASHLTAKTMIWLNFILDSSVVHPYEQALAEDWQDEEYTFKIIRGLQSLCFLLKQCNTSSLSAVYIFTPGLSREQESLLTKSLQSLSFVDLK